MGDALFINKRVLDHERTNSKKRQTIMFNRYTGNQLAQRNLAKFVTAIFENFDNLAEKSELNHNEREIGRLLTSPKSMIIIGTINGVIACYLIAEVTIIEGLKQLMHIYYLFTAPVYRGRGFQVA